MMILRFLTDYQVIRTFRLIAEEAIKAISFVGVKISERITHVLAWFWNLLPPVANTLLIELGEFRATSGGEFYFVDFNKADI